MMTLYLRDKDNKTLVDLDLWYRTDDMGRIYADLSVAIDIRNYSNFLLANLDNSIEIIGQFDYLSELRGWLFESSFINDTTNLKKDDYNAYEKALNALKEIFKETTDKFELFFVID